MTTPKSAPPSISRKSMIRQALFVVVLLLTASFLWLRDQPERLRKAPDGAFTISGDDLYMFASQGMNAAMGIPPTDMVLSEDTLRFQGAGPAELTLLAQSIRDGKKRLVSTEEARYQSYFPSDLSIAQGKLYYAVEPRQRSASGGKGSGTSGIALNPRQFLGSFLAPPNSSPGAGTRGPKRVQPLLTPEIRFRQVPVQGGIPQDAATLRPSEFCLAGNHLFWVRPGPEETVEVTQEPDRGRRTYWTETTFRSDLMLTSLTDGTTRCIRHNVPRSIGMRQGASGVTWTEPAPFPAPPTLWYARVSDGSVRSLGTLTGVQTLRDTNTYRVEEAGGRLYWAVSLQSTEEGTAPLHQFHAMALMSARPDGAGVREVVAHRRNQGIVSLLLHTYKGSLYCCVTEMPTLSKGFPVSEQCLCQVRSDRSDSLEVVHKLARKSGRFQFEGDYLYFVLNEEKRSLWASLTDDDAGQQSTFTLCRVSLEH